MNEIIKELKYSNTNTYFIEGEKGGLLFDTGWAGTLPTFYKALGEQGIRVGQITCLMISHFHPDHVGIAQEIADLGVQIVVFDVQEEYVHAPDQILAKDKRTAFVPIRDDKLRSIALEESRSFLANLGIAGEVMHVPGHSDDSVALCLDCGAIFVGDLNPLYELELHQGTTIGRSWEKLLARKPKTVYYGHAKTARLTENEGDGNVRFVAEGISAKEEAGKPSEVMDAKRQYALVDRIMKLIDKKHSIEKIQKKTGADKTFVEDVARMYLTHPGATAQGVIDRIEIKNK